MHARLAVIDRSDGVGRRSAAAEAANGVSELYVLDRQRMPAVLAPGSDGFAWFLDPQPILYRGVYLSQYDVDMQTDGALSRARGQLSGNCPLLVPVPVPCPDGPPYRSFLYFTFQRSLAGVSWHDGPYIRHGYEMQVYAAATDRAPYSWLSEASQGKPGYFVTGPTGEDSLWRIFRIESDVFHRVIFTLSPVRLNAMCPLVDFSEIVDSVLGTELKQQYDGLCQSVTAQAYRDVVTKARNIVEGVISARLADRGQASSGRLFEDLQTVRKLLDDPKTRESCGWRDIDYHLARKIRLMHGQTHAQQTVSMGRSLRPEASLAVVEDLVELLSAWGYCTH